jgi:hypothetical protein
VGLRASTDRPRDAAVGMLTDCGGCHDCGAPLRRLVDGSEDCPGCGRLWRLLAHGWRGNLREGDCGSCPHLLGAPGPAAGSPRDR